MPPLKLGVVFALTSAVALWAPISYRQALGLHPITPALKSTLGLTFIASVSVVAVFSAVYGGQALHRLYTWWKRRRDGRIVLRGLSPAEKAYLKQFTNGAASIHSQVSDGVAAALSAKGIIVRASSLSAMGGYFPFVLQPWAQKLLAAHPELLDGAESADNKPASARLRRPRA